MSQNLLFTSSSPCVLEWNSAKTDATRLVTAESTTPAIRSCFQLRLPSPAYSSTQEKFSRSSKSTIGAGCPLIRSRNNLRHATSAKILFLSASHRSFTRNRGRACLTTQASWFVLTSTTVHETPPLKASTSRCWPMDTSPALRTSSPSDHRSDPVLWSNVGTDEVERFIRPPTVLRSI